MRKVVPFTLLALSLAATLAFAAKKEIPVTRAECESLDGICPPKDIETFCKGKPKNFQCEFQSVSGGVQLYCADCSDGPAARAHHEAKSCTSNAECAADWVCSEPFRGDVTKVGTPSQAGPNDPPVARYCLPRPPTKKKCGPKGKCAPGEGCVRGLCYAM